MKRAFWVALLVVVLLGAYAALPSSALAWGPCDGPYGGYAGCNYNSGYYGGYYGSNYGSYYSGYVYNRVCYWYGSASYGRLYCTYVRVPAYPASGYYGYGSYYGGGSYGMYSGY